MYICNSFLWLIVYLFIQEKPYQQKWLGKTNFVEIRSFWHLFRSFFRMWTFYVLALQVVQFIIHSFFFSFSVASELNGIFLRWIFMIFYSLFCQVMLIMAWNGLDSPLDLLDPQTFENILSIFITSAVLRFIQGRKMETDFTEHAKLIFFVK